MYKKGGLIMNKYEVAMTERAKAYHIEDNIYIHKIEHGIEDRCVVSVLHSGIRGTYATVHRVKVYHGNENYIMIRGRRYNLGDFMRRDESMSDVLVVENPQKWDRKSKYIHNFMV